MNFNLKEALKGYNGEIYKIDARKLNKLEYQLDVHCSKGTYIRSLCRDIGEKLGTNMFKYPITLKYYIELTDLTEA